MCKGFSDDYSKTFGLARKNKKVRTPQKFRLLRPGDLAHQENPVGEAQTPYLVLKYGTVPPFIRAGDHQLPILRPRASPRVEQHWKAFDRMQPSYEHGFPVNPFRLEHEFGKWREVNAIWHLPYLRRTNLSRNTDGFGFGSHVQSIGSLKVTFLVQVPSDPLLKPLVSNRPWIQHASGADHTRYATSVRFPRKRMVVRKPKAAVVNEIKRPESIQNFRQRAR